MLKFRNDLLHDFCNLGWWKNGWWVRQCSCDGWEYVSACVGAEVAASLVKCYSGCEVVGDETHSRSIDWVSRLLSLSWWASCNQLKAWPAQKADLPWNKRNFCIRWCCHWHLFLVHQLLLAFAFELGNDVCRFLICLSLESCQSILYNNNNNIIYICRWTWVWVNSGSWRWTGKPDLLQSMELQRVGNDWATFTF